jgi:GH25 family lysozyme M1 (1,4-beta-N-acetylmuramidase)
MSLHGVDVANVNASKTVLAAVSSSSNAFVIVKTTEGLTFHDPDHDTFVAAARKAKKAVGHYHFAHPSNDPIKEADYFLSKAKAVIGDTLVLDLEWDQGTWVERANYALRWLAHVKSKTGASPILYVNEYWMNNVYAACNAANKAILTSYPLWIADPANPAGHPKIGPWKVWTLHQYGTVGGLDNDMFNGDLHTWAALAIPAPKPPVTKPPVVVPSKPPVVVPPPTKPVVTPPAPAKAYTMVIFGEAVDTLTAAAATDAFQPKGAVSTGRVDVAKAALAAGDVVVAIGGPANTALGFTHAKAGQVVINGKQVAIQGATAGDSYVLLGRYLATGK